MKKFLLCFLLFNLLCSTSLCFNNINSIEDNNSFLSYSTPEEQGLNSKKLNKMLNYIDRTNAGINSIIIVRNNYMVFEEYPNPGFTNETMHELHSVTKSFTSALIGIAIAQGYIEGINQKILDFFPDKIIENDLEIKQNLTLKHFLTMTAGLEWNENPNVFPNDWANLILSNDPVGYLLNRLIINEPGTRFFYNTGLSHALSYIITKATNMSTLEFANQFLFDPLGIENLIWETDRARYTCGGNGLFLRTFDMMKLGVLYLNNGTWFGEQIIPLNWINQSTSLHANVNDGHYNNGGYGFQWWINPTYNYYFAWGNYFQNIFVLPDQNMVVAFNSNIQHGIVYPELLLQTYIIPAVNDTQANHFWLYFIIIIICAVFIAQFIIYFVRKKIKKN